jgi:hypothetical protein
LRQHIKGATWDQVADSYTSIGVQTPVHDACKICLVTPGNEGAGDVVLNQSDYTHDAQGNLVDLTGSQGHVMLRVPKFYVGYDFSGSTHNWRISLMPFAGSSVHPAFVKAGVEVPYRYIGVYEAAWYDVSAGVYVDGDGTNSAFDASDDKLGSIVGKKPLTNKTRAQFRDAAARVGAGWQLMDFNLHAALKILYITKYADFDSQTVLGAGNTRGSGWDFAAHISATGKVLSVTAVGQSTVGGNSGDYCNLLGIENPYGDIWEWVDGWNILDGVNYVSDNPNFFADDTATNYSLFGSTNPTDNGWQNTLQANIALLPASIGASDATKLCDYYYYYNAAGWRPPSVGGDVVNGSRSGLLGHDASLISSRAYSAIGGRLCF